MSAEANKFSPDIQGLLDELKGPNYFTDFYADIGFDSLIVLTGVFRVDKSYLGNYLGRTLDKKKELYSGRKVLDLGAGCGLLGLICSRNGASYVQFADINPDAVKNCKLNAVLFGLDRNCDFSCGNLFEGMEAGELYG